LRRLPEDQADTECEQTTRIDEITAWFLAGDGLIATV
jgi:hypothetical protein